ncbi:short-chain dehydrogenase [Sorangium cellulosum]|uniref:Short-chain dehydrogenase n=1 Tax=Sorangium cellulosum TaxID=56 RepID=A0A2L0F606_SORCE|nr:SDR family oxidoreductase [Sorangium cellulosum]AUX47000.1 short-chain dehydrogenase [Sorangium cellulosum]
MTKKLRDKVVVITGASSGVGRMAARLFAEGGAAVVLAARTRQTLDEVAAECEAAGGQALVVPTDVRGEDAVRELARRAVERFGRIDVWVNNAAVTLFARTEEAPYEAYRQVIETNLFGYIHGARAVLPRFRAQGQGVLINVDSVAGIVGQPYTSAYCVTKFGIRGLGESLRQELLDAPGIHVCTVMPATIDTPLFQHAANYTGRAVQAMPPVATAERIARAIVGLAVRPRRELIVGGAARLMAAQHNLAPAMMERMMARQVEKKHFQDRSEPPTAGNLFEPMPQWSGVSGGWKRSGSGRGRKLVMGLALGLPAAAALFLLRR